MLFIPACIAINLAFGPNNLLSITIGVQHGWRRAVLSGIGRLVAFIPMMAISAAGLGLILATSAPAFSIVKYLGFAYLIWIGIRILRSAPMGQISVSGKGAPVALTKLARREFLVAAGNPKAIVVFTAYFPQFITNPDAHLQTLAILGAIFIALEIVAMALYAWAGRSAKTSVVSWFSRASGVGMIVFGGLLAFTRRPA